MTYPDHEAQPLLIQEPTYTQVPNELLDAMDKLEPSEFKVLMLICRQTFGWHKESDVISLSQMEEKAGLARNTVIKAVEGLEERHLIKKTKTPSGSAYQLVVQKLNGVVQNLNPPSAKIEPVASAKFEHTKESTKETTIVPKTASSSDGVNGFHRAFIQGWCQNYEAVWGFKYVFDSGKDSKAVKELMTNKIPIVDLIEFAKKAWSVYKNDNKAWNCGQATTIHGFKCRLMPIIAELSASKTATKTNSVYELKTIRDAKQKIADELRYKHCFEGPMGNQWDDDMAREECVKLKKEIKVLEQRIGGAA